MWILSCICLTFVAGSCGVLTFWRAYEDNLVQRVGMVVLTVGCAARVQAIWATEAVANDWFLVHGGMAIIAAGTLWRVYTSSKPAPCSWSEMESKT